MSSDCNGNVLDGFLPFDKPASAERLKQVAENELGENEKLKEECLGKLRKLIKDHSLACISTDDFLLRFLRHRKFDVQRSFERLQKYARMRVAMHERLLKFNPEVLKKCIDRKILGFFPYRDAEERQVFFALAGKWNPGFVSVDELEMAYVLFFNYIAEEESSQVLGVVSLYDVKNVPVSYAAYLLPRVPFLNNFLCVSLPVRYPALYYVTGMTLFKLVLPLINAFLPKKVREKARFHFSRRVISKHISPSILPQEYGGSFGQMSADNLTQVLTDYLQKLKDEQKYFFQQDC